MAVAVALVLLTVCVLAVLKWRERRATIHGRTLCPGPRTRWFARLSPLRLVRRTLCGYDLSGLPAGERGVCTCPECGRTLVPARHALRSARRWRRGPIAAMVCLGVLALWFSPWIKKGEYAALAPTGVLVWAKRQFGTALPRVFSRELARRTFNRQLSATQQARLADALIGDLADDDVKWNAHEALDLFGVMGPAAAPALERALVSPDPQVRFLAARSLHWMQGYAPSDRLIAVTIEGLREHSGYVGESLRWLAECRAPVHRHLERALRSGDWQQRLLAATVAGVLGEDALFDAAAPTLLDALKDNHTDEDAKLAMRALAGFDPHRVIDALWPLTDAPDVQQRTIARAMLRRLGAPEPPSAITDHQPVRVSDIDPTTMEVWALRAPYRHDVP